MICYANHSETEQAMQLLNVIIFLSRNKIPAKRAALRSVLLFFIFDGTKVTQVFLFNKLFC